MEKRIEDSSSTAARNVREGVWMSKPRVDTVMGLESAWAKSKNNKKTGLKRPVRLYGPNQPKGI